MWKQKPVGSSPQGQGQKEQPSGEYNDSLREMSCPLSSWEDGIDRVAKGVPARVHRLKGLGNAIVPQIAEWIGEQIIKDYEIGKTQ